MGYHKSQADSCVLYRKYSVILTYVDDCITVSQKKDKITSVIESLMNDPENHL